MDNNTFLLCLFVICCVWFWVPEILLALRYCKYRIEDFVKKLRSDLKNMKYE